MERAMTKYFMIVLALAWGCSPKESPGPAAAQAAPFAVAPVASAATTEETPPAVVGAASPASAATFTRIADPSTVCMVNDRYMGAVQIPVLVEGKTYYGCCKMCEKRLNDEPSVREALDPISKQAVDKATAVLAQDRAGAVFYFADEASLAKANGG
jgi:YHS domain-containing protein